MAAQALVVALILSILSAPTSAAPASITDTLSIAAGTYYREDIFPPSDGSPFEVSATTLNGSGPFDLYIVHTIDLARGTYPDGDFAPLVASENVTTVTTSFAIPSRLDSYSLIIDNLNNSRPGNARAHGLVQVSLTRTPPLQANPQAQAALATGTTICAAGLGVAAVALVVYMKRRKRPESDEDLAAKTTRIEIPVEIPKPPPGSWARADALEREAEESKG